MNRIILAEMRRLYPALYPKPRPPARPIDFTGVVVGKAKTGGPVSIPWRVRNMHTFLVGPTGVGKTRLMTNYARQLLSRGHGFMFIDPHGGHHDSAFRTLVRLAAQRRRRVHIIDLNCSRVLGFNPLHRPDDTHSSVIVGNLMDAVSAVWSDEPLYTKPTLERNLRVGLTALVELGGTLCDLIPFFDAADRWAWRRRALREINDPVIRYEIERLHALSQDGRRRRDYDQEVIGPANRLARIVTAPVIRAMLGQKIGLDMRAAMDNGDIVLVNLSGGSQAYEAEADLLGRLLIRTALFEAKRRTNTKPFEIMLDEAHRFLSGDVPTLLAEARKYGVAVFASTQWLNQIESVDPKILAALLNGTGTKIIMRLRDADESEKLAKSSIPLNLERPVDALIKPSVVGHVRVHFKNASESKSTSVTQSRATSMGISRAHSEIITRSRSTSETDSHAVTDGISESYTQGFSSTTGGSRSRSTALSHSESDTETTGISSSFGTSNGRSKGSGKSEGQVVWTSTGVFGTEERPSSRESRGSTSHSDESSGTSSQRGSSSSRGKTRSTGRTTSETESENWSDTESESFTEGTNHSETSGHATTVTDGESRGHGKSVSHSSSETEGTAEMRGEGRSEGYSEGLVPVLKDLPSAVHSLQNELYRAGLLLRSLPIATAYINYVGPSGSVATVFVVPPTFTHPFKEFPALLDSLLRKSGAMLVAEALRLVDGRLAVKEEKSADALSPRRRNDKGPREW